MPLGMLMLPCLLGMVKAGNGEPRARAALPPLLLPPLIFLLLLLPLLLPPFLLLVLLHFPRLAGSMFSMRSGLRQLRMTAWSCTA